MAQSYLKTVILSSLVIMFYQGISNSDLGIVTQFTHQNGNNWAGPLCTALLFLGSGLGSLYNKYVGKYKYRYCFFVGAYGYIIFISLGLVFIKLGFNVTTEILIFIMSFIAGTLCSIFYNTQFNYINTLAKIDNKQVQYFGINMAFSQSSSIFGNLFSSLLIKPLGQFTTVLILDIFVIINSFIFLFFREPQKLYGQLLTQNSVSNGQPENQESIISQKEEKKEYFLQKFPPIKVCIGGVFSGLIISFIYCLLVIIIYQTFEDDMTDTQLNHLTFVLFIFQGIGEFIGGLTMVYLSTKPHEPPKILMVTNTLFTLSAGIIFLGYYLQNQYIIGAGIVGVGFCDCSCFVLNLTILGNWKQQGITAFNICQSLTVASSAIIMIFIPVWVSAGYILVFYVLSMIGLYSYQKKITKTVQQTN